MSSASPWRGASWSQPWVPSPWFLQLNTQRLKEFKSKMILFPINAKKPRKGDATAEEMSKAVQVAGTKTMMAKPVEKRPRAMAITAVMQKFKAFQTIRQARAFKRLHGIRAKKAADAEADELSNQVSLQILSAALLSILLQRCLSA